MRKNQQGYTVLWVLIGMAVLFLVFVLFAEFDKKEFNPSFSTWVTLFITAGIIIGGLAVEARYDIYGFCMFFAVVSVFPAVILCVYLFVTVNPTPTEYMMAGIPLAVFLCALTFLLRLHFKKEELPDLLLKTVSKDSIYEKNGVHLSVTFGNTKLDGNSTSRIAIFLQNCHIGPCTVAVKLTSEFGILGHKGKLLFPKETIVELPGAGFASVTIPVAASVGAKGTHGLKIGLAISRSKGRRVRHRRAKALSSTTPSWVSLIGLFAGFLVWGGGMNIRYKITVPPTQEPGPTSLKESIEILWQPKPHELMALESGQPVTFDSEL